MLKEGVPILTHPLTPFGDPKDVNSSSTPNDIPVYVPVGSAEKYRKAWGWDYFTNFIETDDFPTAIYDVTTEHSDSQSSIYDLNGRKVTDTQKGHIYIYYCPLNIEILIPTH